jgi:outer membrane lipoprotein SlyB
VKFIYVYSAEIMQEVKMKNLQFISLVAVIAVITGCASSQSGEVYSRKQAQQAQTVQLGVVEFVKEVQVEGSDSGVGTVAGGVAGAVIGSTIGGGRGSKLAALGGAAIGAITGRAVEEKTSEYTGLEITVKLDSGKVIAVVQEADVPFAVGDRVRVLSDNKGTTRVQK